MDASAALSGILNFVLGVHLPLFLFPSFTWIFGSVVMLGRAKSTRAKVAISGFFLLGFVMLMVLYLVPLIPSVPHTPSSNPSFVDAKLLIVSWKHAVNDVFGNNLIWVLDFEIGSIGALMSVSKSTQKHIRQTKKALWYVFVALLILAIVLLTVEKMLPYLR